MLADRVGAPAAVPGLLAYLIERWDGRGPLRRAKGEQIPVPIRIVHVATDAALQRLLGGPEHAVRRLRERCRSRLRSGRRRVPPRRSLGGARARRSGNAVRGAGHRVGGWFGLRDAPAAAPFERNDQPPAGTIEQSATESRWSDTDTAVAPVLFGRDSIPG
jgi:hypothetical protein